MLVSYQQLKQLNNQEYFVLYENDTQFMQVQEYIVKSGRFARNLVKHDYTLSTMFNAQHRKVVVIPYLLPPHVFFFLFICHGLMLILVTVHRLQVQFSYNFCIIHIVTENDFHINIFQLTVKSCTIIHLYILYRSVLCL